MKLDVVFSPAGASPQDVQGWTGEQNCVRIPGVDLGNSPLEMTETAVKGKTIVVTTTNGTKALLSTQGATDVYLASSVNLSVAGEWARQALERDHDLMILCAGRELIRLGCRSDVLDATRVDAYPVLPRFHDRRITIAPNPT